MTTIGDESEALPDIDDFQALVAFGETNARGLYELAVAALDLDTPAYGYRFTDFDKYADALCRNDSIECTELAVRLVQDIDTHPGAASPRVRELRVRKVAWHLAERPWGGPGRASLVPLFAQPPERLDAAAEFRACLLHELVRRCHGWLPLSTGPGDALHDPVGYGRRLGELGHPLAWLPLCRYRFEQAIAPDPGFRTDGWSTLTTDELAADYPVVPRTEGAAAAGQAAVEYLDPARHAAAIAPVAQSSSQEARFFTLAEPLRPADFNAALLDPLGLAFLAEATPDAVAAAVAHTTGDDVLHQLYIAADRGNVYGEGEEYGAYGRLFAWRAMYALMGLPTDLPLPDAIRQAADYRWLRFTQPDRIPYRCEAGTAYGFAALAPDRTGLAILATTETY